MAYFVPKFEEGRGIYIRWDRPVLHNISNYDHLATLNCGKPPPSIAM